MGRHRFRRIRLIDGPLAGEWRTASVVVPGNNTFRAMTESETRPGMQAVHLYKLKGFSEATWVRRVEIRPMPAGAGQNVPGPRTWAP